MSLCVPSVPTFAKIRNRIEDDQLVKVLEMSFKARVGEVMDQSQHTSADSGGEGAAYEFCQGLDSWERECESLALRSVPCRTTKLTS